MKKRAAFYTLGCKVNYCETESLHALFEQAGYRVVSFDQQADVYVINTCTVTGDSDHKSRKAIRRARRRSPGALIIATGCYAQGAPEQVLEMQQADLLIGNRERENLPRIIEELEHGKSINLVKPHAEADLFELLPPAFRRGRTRGFLKIQEGCNQRCAYCIVPRVRGPLRSMPPAAVLERVGGLVEAGCQEIVLTGVHLGLYGADLEGVTLAGLLGDIEQHACFLRLRLSSIEPSDVTPELIDAISGSQIICPHLHIPLQSGDGEILRLMNRPYEPVEYLYLAKLLKQEIPGLSLSSDVIVGFPGETESHHRRSMALIEEVAFSRLHVFKYSSRPDTAAACLPGHLPNEVKEKRSREMIMLGESMADTYRRSFIGSVQPVLVENVLPHSYGEGYTPHYLRVRVYTPLKGLHWRGKLVSARLESIDGPHMKAVQVRKG